MSGRRRNLRRALAVCPLVAVSVVVAPTPASAALDFSMATYTNGPRDGRAFAKGDVSFPSKRKVRVESWVRDACPQDGDGAYLRMAVGFMDGTVRPNETQFINEDANGCGKKWRHDVSVKTFKKRVRHVVFHVYEYNASTGDLKESNLTGFFDNPRT